MITLDGVKTKVIPADLDGDGETGGIERIPQKFSDNVTNITQETELGGSLRELNSDGINPETRMSAIDMRTRLASFEISAVLAVDSLVALGVLPQKCLPLSTQKKRLNVSEGGKGREEMVTLVAGKREQDAKLANSGGGFMNGVKSMFGGGGR